jgi:NADPH2:quinone reductase
MAYAIYATKPGGTEVLEKHDFELDEPGPDEVLIRHNAIGVNFIDVYIRTGAYPWPVEENLILGCEAAGVIEAVGPGVSGFREGDRVAYTLANGAYSTHRNINVTNVVHLPDHINDETAAACMLKGLTCYYLLHNSYKVEAGDKILFHAAAGGVGLIAGQWLAAKGATAIGTAGSDEKCELALANGYTDVINYKTDDFVAGVKALTEAQMVDVVYDSVGKDTWPGSRDCLKRHGTLVSFGQSSGPAEDFKISDLAVGSLYLTRPTLFHFAADRSWLESASAALFDMIGSGRLNIAVNQTFDLADAGKAHEALESRATTGSTVLIP